MQITIKPAAPVLIKDMGIIPTPTGKENRKFGLYECECGKHFMAQSRYILSGNTKSCGCYKVRLTIDKNTTHNMTKHPIFKTWLAMRRRCTIVNNKDYPYYGGRGITVCSEWLKFENFRDDMLPTWKQGLSIDRINNDGNYEPDNCRWATKNIQARNTIIIKSNNTSGYRGVSFHKRINKWQAYIVINSIQKSLGYFYTALEAAKAYDTYVIENNLEHTINSV